MRRIPKAFQLGPHRWTVEIVTAERMREVCEELETRMEVNERPPLGLTVYQEHRILVQRASKRFPKAEQMHAFWHEYFHALLMTTGRERLARDEGLVDLLGGLQLQALLTSEN